MLLLKHAADPKFARRLETAQAVTDLLVRLKDGAAEAGHAIEIPKCAWQYTGDKTNSRTLVPATDESIPDFEFE